MRASPRDVSWRGESRRAGYACGLGDQTPGFRLKCAIVEPPRVASHAPRSHTFVPPAQARNPPPVLRQLAAGRIRDHECPDANRGPCQPRTAWEPENNPVRVTNAIGIAA